MQETGDTSGIFLHIGNKKLQHSQLVINADLSVYAYPYV